MIRVCLMAGVVTVVGLDWLWSFVGVEALGSRVAGTCREYGILDWGNMAR